MAVELTMPQMDQTMTTGTVGKWLVKEGDAVKEGEPVLEIETDKVTVELESPADGDIAQILVEEGSKVPVNAVLAIIAAMGEEVEKQPVGLPVEEAVAEPAPSEAPGKLASPAPPVKTSVKASPAARKLAQQHGVDLAQVKGSGPGGRIVESDMQAYISRPEPLESDRLRASPLARRLAKERGLDLAVITGSGSGGRIVRDDILQAVEAAKRTPAEPIPAPEVVPAEVIPMAGMRQIIAERMTLSHQTTASVTLNTEVDVTELIELRSWLNAKLSATEVKLTYTDLLVKIAAHALRQHPRLNSTLQDDGIHLIKQINIGVGVALEDGLVIPVITDADCKGLSEISREIKELADKARNNKLSPGELRGGTFTITNLGMFGIDTFTPIINPPECAILGVGRIVKKPVVYEDEITVRSMMNLSLSFDYRIIDGAPAAQFLQTVMEYIKGPYLLLV